MIELAVLLALLFICLFLSAFFSGAEMAYNGANRIRLENMEENGDKAASRALKIIRNYETTLSAILIGNNLVNIAASSISSVIVLLIFGNIDFSWVSTLVITSVVIVFCETIPKIVSAKKAVSRSLKYSVPILSVSFILKPLIFIVVKLTDLILLPFKGSKEETDEETEESVEELQSIIDTAEDEGVLDTDDKEIITNAIDFAEISAYEAMTARVDVEAIDIDDSFNDIKKQIENTPFSRLPVYQNSIDNIIGVLHLNRFLQEAAENAEKDKFDIRSLLMKPCYVYKTMKMPTVLKELKKAKQHLAIVTDEYSGTLGIITMEDVLEELVGDIWDETDTIENDIVVKNNGEYIVDGDLPISDFLDLVDLDEDIFEADSETVGGWAVEVLEKFPSKGDSFTAYGLEVNVLSVDGRRVEKLSVKKTAHNEAE